MTDNLSVLLGDNVSAHMVGTKLVLEVETDVEGRLSKSEISRTLATTGSPTAVPQSMIPGDQETKVSLTIFRAIPDDQLTDIGRASKERNKASRRKAA